MKKQGNKKKQKKRGRSRPIKRSRARESQTILCLGDWEISIFFFVGNTKAVASARDNNIIYWGYFPSIHLPGWLGLRPGLMVLKPGL